MRGIWHLSWHNLKKEKGKHCSFGLIMLLTALILHIAMMLALHIESSYDDLFQQQYGANINITMLSNNQQDTIKEQLSNRPEIAEVELQKGLYLNTTIKNFAGTDFEVNTMFYPDLKHRINTWEWFNQSSEISTGIGIPLYISEFGEYEIGNTIVYEINGETRQYDIQGVFQEMQYGNFSSGSIGVVLSKAEYQTLQNLYPSQNAVNFAIRIKDGYEHEKVLKQLETLMVDQHVTILQSDVDCVRKEARLMIANLIIMVLVAFASIVLLVGICLINFRIKHMIDEEITSLGVLKALGYTAKQIILSQVLPNLIVSSIFVSFGIATSYSVLPMVASLIELQAGFQVNLVLDPIIDLFVFGVLISLICIGTYVSARTIQGLQPIQAIHGIKGIHQKQRNPFSIQQTKGPISFILMLKSMVFNIRQSILLFSVLFIVTYLISFAGILFYNGLIEPTHFTDPLNVEMPSTIIYTDASSTNEMKDCLQHDSKVKDVLLYQTFSAVLNDEHTTLFVSETYDRIQNDFCYEGRNPKSSSEIAIGSAFLKNKNIKINDRVVLTYENIKKEFTVTGFLQSVNHQGAVVEITQDGFQRLHGQTSLTSLYVYLHEESNTASFLEQMKEDHEDKIIQVINSYELNETGQQIYTQVLQMVIIIILLLSIGMVTLILYVLMKSLITSRKQELGIYKAMGYSNRQIMIQISGGLLIPALSAILISVCVALFTIPKICDMIWMSLGVYKGQFDYPIMLLVLCAWLIWSISAIIIFLLSYPIKKISAYTLLKE